MTLAYDLVVSGVIICIAAVVHLLSIMLFAPGTELHILASEATMFSGAQRAQLWFEILSVWVPAGGLVVAFTWPIVRAYRRQARTAQRAAAP